VRHLQRKAESSGTKPRKRFGLDANWTTWLYLENLKEWSPLPAVSRGEVHLAFAVKENEKKI